MFLVMRTISVALAFFQHLFAVSHPGTDPPCSIFSYTLTVPEQHCPGEDLGVFCLWSRLRPMLSLVKSENLPFMAAGSERDPLCSALLALSEENIQTA